MSGSNEPNQWDLEYDLQAHNPKVVSSNLPSATNSFFPFSDFGEPRNHPN